MTFTDVKTYLETHALAVTGVESFEFDWIANVNGRREDLDFPAVVLQPPIERATIKGIRTYEVTYYLLDDARLTDGDGVEMTMDEKCAAWDVLRGYCETFHRAFLDKPTQITEWGKVLVDIRGDVKYTRDEGLSNRDDIFLKVEFTLNTQNAPC